MTTSQGAEQSQSHWLVLHMLQSLSNISIMLLVDSVVKPKAHINHYCLI